MPGGGPLNFCSSSLLGKKQRMVQVFESLPPTWETQVGSLAPDFGLVQPPAVVVIQEINQWMGDLTPCQYSSSTGATASPGESPRGAEHSFPIQSPKQLLPKRELPLSQQLLRRPPQNSCYLRVQLRAKEHRGARPPDVTEQHHIRRSTTKTVQPTAISRHSSIPNAC